jgi:hypothetical protein
MASQGYKSDKSERKKSVLTGEKTSELDVFVGNFAIIDWELFSLWLSGRSVAEAAAIFVRDNRSVISDYHVSQDIILSDLNDNWRLFTMLESTLLVIIRTYADARRRKLRSNFRLSGSEFIILRIPKTEKWPFWFWTVTGDNIFFSVGNQFCFVLQL